MPAWIPESILPNWTQLCSFLFWGFGLALLALAELANSWLALRVVKTPVGVWDQIRQSRGSLALRGMLRISLASWGMNNCCTWSAFQVADSRSMRRLTLALDGREGGGIIIDLHIWSRSHLSSLMHTNYPFPTCHTKPFWITSLALRMLFQA